jgi:hypothetical protein
MAHGARTHRRGRGPLHATNLTTPRDAISIPRPAASSDGGPPIFQRALTAVTSIKASKPSKSAGFASSFGAANASSTTYYYYYCTVVFRDRPNGIGWDRWRGQSWEPATGTLYPSFEEYLHMRRITEQEARARIPAAFADD